MTDLDKGTAVQDAVAQEMAMAQARKELAKKVKVKPLDMEGKGFLKKYRDVLAIKEAFFDFENASLKAFDDAIAFLKEHIVEPESERAKEALLDELDMNELLALFEAITGAASTVPPASGGE